MTELTEERFEDILPAKVVPLATSPGCQKCGKQLRDNEYHNAKNGMPPFCFGR